MITELDVLAIFRDLFFIDMHERFPYIPVAEAEDFVPIHISIVRPEANP